MKQEALIKELAAMQKDLQEMKRAMIVANTRYNRLNYRVNQLKRRISADIRTNKTTTLVSSIDRNETQTSLRF